MSRVHVIIWKEVIALTLGSRVVARRKELGLTQADLAKRMGYVSRASIAKVEGGREVGQRIVARLAEALDVTVPYLMGWERKPEEQAAFDASILLDEDIMEVVHGYRTLDGEQKAAVKQMIKLFTMAK